MLGLVQNWELVGSWGVRKVVRFAFKTWCAATRVVGSTKTVMVGLAATEPLVFRLEGRIAQSAEIGWHTACTAHTAVV